MSRSKEGRDQTAPLTGENTESGAPGSTLDERLGAQGQTDYTAGRESYRDFPKRSTSARGRAETGEQSRELYGDRSRTNRGAQTSSRFNESERFSGRSRWNEESERFSQRGRGPRPAERFESEQRGRFGTPGRPGRQDYGRYGGERESGRTNYDELTGRADRYRENERDFGYAGGRGYNRERDYDADPYNRESFSGQYGSYERGSEPSRGNLGWGAGSGIDYNQYRGERSDRYECRCGDIMTRSVTCCSPQNSVRDVADMMEDENVGSIPVLENGRLVGIITDRDIVCRVIADGRDTRSTPTAEVMSKDIVTCLPDDSIHEAIRKMSEHQIRRIPVTDYNGRLRGIISMADIALEAERDQELAQALENISQPTPNRSRKI